MDLKAGFPSASIALRMFSANGDFEPGVEIQAPLKRRLDQREFIRCHASRHQELESMRRYSQKCSERFRHLGVSDAPCFDIDYVLKIIQQDYRDSGWERRRKRLRNLVGGGLGIFVQLFQFCRLLVVKQLSQTGVKIRQIWTLVIARGAQVDNAIDAQRSAIIREPARFQRPQETANHCRFPHAAAADHGQQSQRGIHEEIANQPRLHVTVLKVRRRDKRRRVNELRLDGATDRNRRPSFPLETGLNALLHSCYGRLRIVHNQLLRRDLLGEVLNIRFDTRPLLRLSPRQLSLCIGQPVSKLPQDTPSGVLIHCRCFRSLASAASKDEVSQRAASFLEAAAAPHFRQEGAV